MYGSISTTALEFTHDYLTFARCERPDGTFYGTNGKCRKGKEVAPALRRARGQSLEGADLDYPKLKDRARRWAKENGLGDPDDVLPGHDETHVLVRDYLGKTSQALGSLMGEKSKGGPTNFEEVLVEAFENLSRNPKADTGKLFPESIRETFSLSKNLGVLPDNHLYNRDPQRATSVSVRYLEEITKRPDFAQFLLTVKTARRKAREDS